MSTTRRAVFRDIDTRFFALIRSFQAIAEHFEAEKFTSIDAANRLTAKKIVEMAMKDNEAVDPEDIASAVETIEGGDEDDDKSSKRSRDDDI